MVLWHIHQNCNDEKHWKYQHSDPVGWGINLMKPVGRLFDINTEHMHTLSPAFHFQVTPQGNAHQKTSTRIFTASLFRSTPDWKQPKCSSRVNWSILGSFYRGKLPSSENEWMNYKICSNVRVQLINLILSKRSKTH